MVKLGFSKRMIDSADGRQVWWAQVLAWKLPLGTSSILRVQGRGGPELVMSSLLWHRGSARTLCLHSTAQWTIPRWEDRRSLPIRRDKIYSSFSKNFNYFLDCITFELFWWKVPRHLLALFYLCSTFAFSVNSHISLFLKLENFYWIPGFLQSLFSTCFW